MFVSDFKLGGNNPYKNDGLLTNWPLIYHATLRDNRSSNLHTIQNTLVFSLDTGRIYSLQNNSKSMKRNERKLYGKYQIYAVTKHKLTILNCTVKNQGRIYYHFFKKLV